ncbi:MAG TPA: hypothetical protein DIW44_12595 [Anaerolineaceae bacterium]|nr:hypothetical protein [Anaerolineaceae bacterium]
MELSQRSSEETLYSPLFINDWPKISLFSLADWLNGMAFRDFEFSSSGIPIIKIAEIKNGISGQTKFSNKEYNSKYSIKPGDMLFPWSGQPETSIDVHIWKDGIGWLNQHIFKVSANKLCNQKFLFYLLKYLKPTFISIAKNKQTIGLGHVTVSDLKKISVGLPSQNEQQVIAEILSSLDDKIELNRRLNLSLELLGQTFYKQLFTNNPEKGQWECKFLPEVFDINPTRELKSNESSPYLDIANTPIQGHRVINWYYRSFTSGTKFINGDTLLARITPCLENGKTAYVDFLENGQTGWGSTEFIVFHPKPPFPSEFGYFFARSKELRDFAIQNMSGTSGRQRVPTSCFSSFSISIPPELILKRFEDQVKDFMILIKDNDIQSRTLAKLRDTLLPKLISGLVRVKERD